VADEPVDRVAAAVGERAQALGDGARREAPAAHQAVLEQPEQGHDQPGRVALALAELGRPLEGGVGLGVGEAGDRDERRPEGQLEVELEPVALRRRRQRVASASSPRRRWRTASQSAERPAARRPAVSQWRTARSASAASVKWCAISSGVASAASGNRSSSAPAIRAWSSRRRSRSSVP
jgi:hypothetical protein